VPSTTPTCRICGRHRDLGGFLRVTPLRGEGQPYLVCRPITGRSCFRRVRGASIERIELADPVAAKAFEREISNADEE
jgi:hypothetical protein